MYCTKGSRCNIILRHQGATVFTLKELVIKAPRHNYTSPVQEGMVFISMEDNSLLDRTAQYQIQYLPCSSTLSRSAPSQRLPASERLRARREAGRGEVDEVDGTGDGGFV